MKILFSVIHNIIIILTINFGSYAYSYQNINLIGNNQNTINKNNTLLHRSNSMKNLYNPFNLINIYNNDYSIFINDDIINNSNDSSSSNWDITNSINNTSSISTNISNVYSMLSVSSNTTYHNIFSNINSSTSIGHKSIKSVINNNIDFNKRCGYDNLFLVEWSSYFTESVTISYFSNNNDSHVNLNNSINYLNDN